MTLAELRKLAEARTKGEWSVEKPHHNESTSEYMKSLYEDSDKFPSIFIAGEHCIPSFYDYEEAGIPRNDADFIAAAANHVDALLDVIEAAKTVLVESNAYFDDDGAHFQRDILFEALAKLEAIK